MNEQPKATTVSLTETQKEKAKILALETTGRAQLTAYVCYTIERDWKERETKLKK